MARLACKMGIVGTANAEHSTADMSGKGRGGYDANFAIDVASMTVTKAPLRPYQESANDVGDADDVNAAYDEACSR